MSSSTTSLPSPRRGRRGLRLGASLSLFALLVLGIAGGIALSARTHGGEEVREITLTARDMAFYLPGDPTPNPTLVVKRGEAVRLTLVNEDLGMRHDFAVGALDLESATLDKVGERTTLEFEAPDEPGRSEYVCSFHVQMMKGVLRVE